MSETTGDLALDPAPVNGAADEGPGPTDPGGIEAGPGPGPGAPAWVYAIGRIEPRFPSLGVEKELAQVTGRADTAGLTDRQVLQSVLTNRSNRYLARQLCWALTIEGLDTYLLVPRDPDDLDLLLDAIRAAPRPTDVDVVIGERGPLAPPDMCNGLAVPVVFFDQIYSFDVDSLVAAIPRPEGTDEEQFRPAAAEVFALVQQLADNAGATDDQRALNYLTVRYPAIYARAAEAFSQNASITAVDVRPSRLSGVRTIVDVVFTFTDRRTDTSEQAFVRVDVTEKFPFLVTKLSPYYGR